MKEAPNGQKRQMSNRESLASDLVISHYLFNVRDLFCNVAVIRRR